MAAQGRAFWTEERVELLKQLWLAGAKIGAIALQLGNTEDACSSKRRALGLPNRDRGKVRGSPQRHRDYSNLGPAIAEFDQAMQPETAAQSAIWLNVTFTDHPAAARPEGKLRGRPDSARSMVGCAAALLASN